MKCLRCKWFVTVILMAESAALALRGSAFGHRLIGLPQGLKQDEKVGIVCDMGSDLRIPNCLESKYLYACQCVYVCVARWMTVNLTSCPHVHQLEWCYFRKRNHKKHRLRLVVNLSSFSPETQQRPTTESLPEELITPISVVLFKKIICILHTTGHIPLLYAILRCKFLQYTYTCTSVAHYFWQNFSWPNIETRGQVKIIFIRSIITLHWSHHLRFIFVENGL